MESGGVYGEEEKRFVFNNVIVGRRAKARFKISNTTKVSIYLCLTNTLALCPGDVGVVLKPFSCLWLALCLYLCWSSS